jgi:putative transposase
MSLFCMCPHTSQRTFICEVCGHMQNRGINAAQNILKRALNSVSSTTEGHSGSQACGDDVRPSTRKAVAEEAGTTRVAS